MASSRLRSLVLVCCSSSLLLASPACDDDTTGTHDTADAAPADLRDSDPSDTHGLDSDADTGPVAPPDLAVVPGPGEVRAGFTVKPQDLIGGPKAEGLVGDVKLWNARAAFLIETIRATGGFRERGGNVIDIDFSSGGEDRFGELWFAWNLELFHPETVEVVSDGRDGEAVVRFAGRTGRYVWIQTFIAALLNPAPIDLAVVYEYRLAPDSDVLELSITLTNDGPEAADVELPLSAMNMGDGVRPFGIGGGLGGVTGRSQPWLGMTGLSRSYGFVGDGALLNGLFNYQNVQILQADPFSLPPGESITQRYVFVVGDDGTRAVAEVAAERFGVGPVVEVAGAVTGEVGWLDDEPTPSNTGGRAWVTAFVGDAVHGVTPVDAAGRFSLLLAPGDYQLVAYAPQRGGSEPLDVTLAEGAPVDDLTLDLPALGEVVVTVSDADARPLPVEISFFRVDAPWPFAPESAGFDANWRHDRSAVIFSPDGLGRAHLLPGTYTVTASRGFSYTFDEATIEVLPGQSQSLALQIERVVDDTGWVSADLHLHSIWSPDSDTPYIARLRQAAANDVLLPVFSEHVNLGHAHVFLDESGVEDWVLPVPAQEVTTFEYGHFNSYPLEYRPDEPSFGAVYEHGHAGHELFTLMREQREGDHIIQINHPRGVPIMGYFTYLDFDRSTASADDPRWTTDWDVLEVFNGDCGPGGGNAESLEDWFALNDHGLRKALGSGSDSHSEAAGLGFPRSWIEVDHDEVAADLDALVVPLRARKSFVSCGPFVRFSTSDGKGLGELAAVSPEGVVSFEVEVEAPAWIGLSSVVLLENGTPIAEVEAADFVAGDGAVRHAGSFAVTPAADAWYVLVVEGEGDLWPVEPGGRPYAMTNPIEVDADGDGVWTPPARGDDPPVRARAPSRQRDHHHGHDHAHGHDHHH